MAVEIRHSDGRSHSPWWSYHYRGEEAALGGWRNIGGSQCFIKDAQVEVISDSVCRVMLSLKDGCIMNPRLKRKQSLMENIDIYRIRLAQEKMEISMSVGDELTFNIPGCNVSIRAYEPLPYMGLPARP